MFLRLFQDSLMALFLSRLPMKGIVFTQFISMVSELYGEDLIDDVLDSLNLESGGAYTSVGTYPHQELVVILSATCEKTKVTPSQMLEQFGGFLLLVFREKFPEFFASHSDPLSFLERVDDYVHVEVYKLYPDAELPRFECRRLGTDELQMDYRSSRHLHYLALGLIKECIKSYGAQGTVSFEEIPSTLGPVIRFKIQLS